MSSFLDKLNLGPQERRLVVVSAAVMFVVLQLWLVWPHFGDLNRIRQQKQSAERTLERYQTELARTGE